MPVFNPIRSERKLRRFGVLDLEWVPGETLPELVNTEVQDRRDPQEAAHPPAGLQAHDRAAPAAAGRLLRPGARGVGQ